MTAATAHLTAAGQRLGKQQHQQQGKKDSVEETVYDERHPLYNGDWKRSIPGINDDIAMDTFDEPHVKRKLAILEKHPEIKNFYGVEPRTIGVTCLLASLQLALSWVFGKALADYSIWPLVITAYFIGGTATQICGVIIHEVSHNLASESPLVNRLVGLTCNLTIPFPIAASFRRYHLDHHAFQGVEGKDPDLPLKWEIYLVKGNMFMKALFLFCYPLMYVVRGLAMQKVCKCSPAHFVGVVLLSLTNTC